MSYKKLNPFSFKPKGSCKTVEAEINGIEAKTKTQTHQSRPEAKLTGESKNFINKRELLVESLV